LDATHFRQRAARAREMAQSGDDLHLSRMLLEVALDLDAEAEAMEADDMANRRGFARGRPMGTYEGLLHGVGPEVDTRPVQIINLSVGGAIFRVDRMQTPGSSVILELPGHALRLDGSILRMRGMEAAMIFDPASSADPDLSRLLQSETLTDRVQA
jgi:hypothetical protein